MVQQSCAVSGRALRVVLADPPFGARWRPYALASPNLGLLYLAAYLRRTIPHVEVYYLDGRRSLKTHLRLVRDLRPAIYGLSFASPYASVSLEVINRVKAMVPDALVVCGGPHPSADPAAVLSSCRADACCVGEGEETFAELVRRHLNGLDVRDTAGIAYCGDSGEVKVNAPRPLIQPLDAIPFPAWDLVDFSRFAGCRPARGRPSTAIIASRGCPFRCVFCSNPVWNQQRPRIRLRSPENIQAEVAYLYDRGVREIYIRSDEMNPSPDWCVAVFRALGELKKPDLRFQCNLRPCGITEELAASLAGAKCWLVNLGIESASQRVLDGIEKRIKIQDAIRACELLKRHDVRVRAFFMLYQVWEKDNMLQVETTREVMSTLAFAVRQHALGRLDYMSWAFATPFPWSRLYDIARRYRLLRERQSAVGAMGCHEAVMTLPGISRREMAVSRALGLVAQGVFALTSRDFLRQGQFWRTLRLGISKMRYALRPW